MNSASSVSPGTAEAIPPEVAMEQYLQWHQMKRRDDLPPYGIFVTTWLMRYNILEEMGIAPPPFSAIIILLNQYQDVPVVSQVILPEIMAMGDRALHLDQRALYEYCEQLMEWEDSLQI
ncbi:uncharacterized protein N7500_008451 [Penicillium coprophilum]|uniref:uncharacterized protein n=1 Tax=Penicillium coprophilum TaxID=36646 RepID=UPI0023A43EC6|nr:uncharacterized protein N7500_008451 [Penicillium coprophilum]KAJ5158800.1 hypothetical protein N7500_008451 [Penicillium coprophilum]